MPAGLLFLLYLSVALAPLGLAWAQGLPPRGGWDELASGAGLLALAMLLAEFPMSGRFRVISRRVGMDVTMRFHQLLARTALVLALIHPFLYRGERDAPLVWDTTRQLTLSWQPETILPGAVAWLLLPVLVGVALARSDPGRKYQWWRLFHGVGALIIVVFGVWHALVAGRYSTDPTLTALWLGFLGVAVLTLVRVYLVAPLIQSRHPWRVTRAAHVAERTWEVVLTPDGHDGMRYKAGQFAWLNIGHSPFSLNENPFSIASAPSGGSDMRFVIKELGDFTRSLGQIEPGARAYLDGPFGHLTLTGRTAPGVALIAGGVGIAPLLGLLREIELSGDDRPVTLIYANRHTGQIVDKQMLDALAAQGRVSVVHVLSEPPQGWQGETGMVDVSLLKRHFDTVEHKEWDYVLCGPPPMLKAVERDLIALGIPSGHILSEAFSYD
ncbi:ferredoxin reductase family protein [Arenibacterium sp. CAU 1754]